MKEAAATIEAAPPFSVAVFPLKFVTLKTTGPWVADPATKTAPPSPVTLKPLKLQLFVVNDSTGLTESTLMSPPGSEPLERDVVELVRLLRLGGIRFDLQQVEVRGPRDRGREAADDRDAFDECRQGRVHRDGEAGVDGDDVGGVRVVDVRVRLLDRPPQRVGRAVVDRLGDRIGLDRRARRRHDDDGAGQSQSKGSSGGESSTNAIP